MYDYTAPIREEPGPIVLVCRLESTQKRELRTILTIYW